MLLLTCPMFQLHLMLPLFIMYSSKYPKKKKHSAMSMTCKAKGIYVELMFLPKVFLELLIHVPVSCKWWYPSPQLRSIPILFLSKILPILGPHKHLISEADKVQLVGFGDMWQLVAKLLDSYVHICPPSTIFPFNAESSSIRKQ